MPFVHAAAAICLGAVGLINGSAAVVSFMSQPKGKPDSVIGTFTVKGKTTILKHVYATLERDQDDADQKYLVLLVSDIPVAPPDRTPTRLKELSGTGKLRAIRIVWVYGTDGVWGAPYHAGIAEHAQRSRGQHTLSLDAFDDKNVTATVESKMLGQSWFYKAQIKAAVAPGGTIELEPELPEPVETPSAPSASASPQEKKIALAKMGYQYNGEMFTHAVKDGHLEAVKLFLALGTSANTKDSIGYPVLMSAAMSCARPPEEARTPIIQTLLAAGADVKAKDDNNSTPLLWAVQSCDAGAIEALVKAGSDVNAKAKGGGTPLMMAQVLNRPEIVKILQQAGAR